MVDVAGQGSGGRLVHDAGDLEAAVLEDRRPEDFRGELFRCDLGNLVVQTELVIGGRLGVARVLVTRFDHRRRRPGGAWR